MYKDVFKPGENVRVLSPDELKAHYKGPPSDNGLTKFGDFVPEMLDYCNQIFTIKRCSMHDENELYYGYTTYRLFDGDGNELPYWFPDFSLAKTESDEKMLEDWQQIMHM